MAGHRWYKSGVTGKVTGPLPPLSARVLTSIFGTGLGTGYVPVAQGTAGSALAVLLWVWLVPDTLLWEMGVIVGLHVISVPLSWWGERMWGPDPGRITVDEFAGQAVALLAVPREPVLMLSAFLLFRLFDTFKLRFIRGPVESMPGGWGVTLDDTVAGIMARIVMIPVVWAILPVLGA